MSARLVNVDRETPMMLPPSLKDWVAEDDMVHFVLEAVEGMHLPQLKLNRRGSGSAQYPPQMMLALLIYCYANGIFSSRKIERATWRDVSVRYLTGDTHPDHDMICSFRKDNSKAIQEAFRQLLLLAHELKVVKLGTISVDGTQIKANASKHKNVRYERAGALEKQLEADIAELMSEAEAADEAGDEEDDRLPRELARREALREKMAQARRDMEERAHREEAERQEREQRNWKSRRKR